MTPISISIPESLSSQKAELEGTLSGIATEEEKLAAQRKDIEVALNTIATGIAVLSGQPLPAIKNAAAATARKPMSEDAKKRIAEGLRKAREAKAKAAQIVVSEPQTPAPPFADALVAIPPREPRSHRKAVKEDDATAG